MDLLAKILFVPEFSAYHESLKSLTYVGKGAPPSFTFKTINAPIPKNKLMIRIRTATLSHLDVQLMNMPISLTSPGQKGIGRDFCGVIEEIGANWKGKYEKGQKVCGMFIHLNGQGTIGDYVLIDPSVDHIIDAPGNLSDEEIAAFPLSLGIAWKALKNAKLDKDSSVCILGGNTSVGQYAIQLAKKHYGVEKVVVTSSMRSEPFMKQLGADLVIDYKSATNIGHALEYVIGLKQIAAKDMSSVTLGEEGSKKKFRLILDCVGGTDVLDKAYNLVEPYSRSTPSAYVTIVGDIPMSFEYGTNGYTFTNPLSRKLANATTGYAGVNYIYQYISQGDWLETVADLVSSGEIKASIDSVWEINQFMEAIDRVESGKLQGKVIIKVSSSPTPTPVKAETPTVSAPLPEPVSSA